MGKVKLPEKLPSGPVVTCRGSDSGSGSDPRQDAVLHSQLPPPTKNCRLKDWLGVLLKEQDLADILAFLDTLKTPPKDGITVPVKKPNQYE